MELADTSAWISRRKRLEPDEAFDRALQQGLLATCDLVKLELLVRARDAKEVTALREHLDALRAAPMGERVWRRAMDVMERFAEQGPLHHRQVPIQDLLIAAAAERAELPVLHYDRHFETIASVTGQPVRAIAPLGSL